MGCHRMSVVRTRAPSQYPKRRLIVRSREVSKSWDLYLELSDRSEIWQALRQHCCRFNLKYQSGGFETSRDLTTRRLFGYWDGAPVVMKYINKNLNSQRTSHVSPLQTNHSVCSEDPVVMQYINKNLNSQRTPHVSPWWTSHGMSVVIILERIYHAMAGPHFVNKSCRGTPGLQKVADSMD